MSSDELGIETYEEFQKREREWDDFVKKETRKDLDDLDKIRKNRKRRIK